MKFSQKLSIALFAATTSVFSLSSGAFAGEGAAAGSAAFTIDNSTATPTVTGVAVAASVGKNDASAAAYNSGTANSAFALGSAGLITGTNIGDSANASMVGTADADLATDQGNDLTGAATIDLGTVAGDNVITLP